MTIRQALDVARTFETGYPVFGLTVESDLVVATLAGIDPLKLAIGLVDAYHTISDPVVTCDEWTEYAVIRIDGHLRGINTKVTGSFGDQYSRNLIDSMPLGLELLEALTQREYARG